MAKKHSNRRRNDSQEIFTFGKKLSIPEAYDFERAKKAARRRDVRIGNVARIEGFKKKTSGLFVPHSGSENTAIIKMPYYNDKQEQKKAKERVQEKYAEDESVSIAQVDAWSKFSGYKTKAATRREYRKYMLESADNAARIGRHLFNVSGGVISREFLTYDPEYRKDPEAHRVRDDVLAYNAVLKYFMDLETLIVGHPDVLRKAKETDDEPSIRVWPSVHHKNVLRRRMDRVHEQLEPLADDKFAERVDEAYWSHFSRELFWVQVDNDYTERARARNREISSIPPEMPPIDIYVSEAEAIEARQGQLFI